MAPRRVTSEAYDLERVVLAHCTAFDDAARLEAAGLQVGHFSLPEHQTVWAISAALLAKGLPVDAVTIHAEMVQRGDMGWTFAQLASLDAHVPRAHDALLIDYVARLRAKAAHRAVLSTTRALVETLETDADALGSDAVDAALTAIDHARQDTTRERLWCTAHDAPHVYLDELERRATGDVVLGIPALDTHFGGFASGEVVGLMARPSMGKTVLLCHQARVSGQAGLGHVVFSLEMPGAQIIGRLAQGVFGLGRRDLALRANAGAINWTAYQDQLHTVTIVDRQGLTVADMATILRRLQDGPMRDTPIRVVTVDHLGLVAGHDRHEEYTRVSRIARELKDFAKRFGVVVMVAVQVNRDAGGDGSKRLHLGSARDSGVVEEAVDYLVAFRRFDRTETQPEHVRRLYHNALFLSAPKVRHGDPPQDELAVTYDQTLVITPALDLSVPDSADGVAKVSHFGGRR